MKKFLSIEGWNPEFYKGGYEVGAYIAFKMPQSNILRVGIAIEPPEGKSAPAIKCLTNNKIYYPYPELIRPFDAVIYESRKILFGKGKSNDTEYKEALNLMGVALKSATGAFEYMYKILRESNEEFKLLRESNSEFNV